MAASAPLLAAFVATASSRSSQSAWRFIAAGLVWFSQISAHGSFLVDILGTSLLAAVGLEFAFVPVTIATGRGACDREPSQRFAAMIGRRTRRPASLQDKHAGRRS